jgi:hypothetical protein
MTRRPARRPFGWRSGIVCTVLVSLAFTSSGTLTLTEDPMWAVLVFLSSVVRNLLTGAVIVATTWIAAPRVSMSWLMATILAGVAAMTLLRIAVPPLTGIYLFGARPPPASDHLTVSPIYLAWLQLLYGGLFAGGFALVHRVERTRAALARAELARSQVETLLAQAELANLRGAVDPAFLLRVLDEARARHADAARPDRLLERLVDFLRVAMPGIRSGGRSTLGAELAVIASRMWLADELEPQAPRWQCDVEPALADLPFPPLLLLPIVERLTPPGASGGALAIVASSDERGVTLTLTGGERGGDPPVDLLRRLRIGLQAMHGRAVDVGWHVDAARGHALTMTLPRGPDAAATGAPGGAEPSPPRFPSRGGTWPWHRRTIPTT